MYQDSTPEKMPPEPMPATSLPKIKPIEFGVAPQTRLPSSKMPNEIKKTHLIGNRLYNLPYESWKAQVVSLSKSDQYESPVGSSSSYPYEIAGSIPTVFISVLLC